MIDNPHQSDLVVNIYSSINALIDYKCFRDEYTDKDGFISYSLSKRFNQSWLVYNSFSRVAPETFHSDYLRLSLDAQNCYISVIFVDPSYFCSSLNDIDVFIHTLLNINRVLKRKILIMVSKFPENTIDEYYAKHIGSLAGSVSGNLAAGIILQNSLTSLGFVDLLVNWIVQL